MRHVALSAVALMLLLLLCLGAGLWVVVDRTRVGGPIYSVSQVETGLQQDPHAWLGRSVRVRGSLLSILCGPRGCDFPPYAIMDARTSGSFLTLPLDPLPDAFLGWFRRIPGLGRLLPAPQPLSGIDVFRVTIRQAPTSSQCPVSPCYEAVLFDARPAR